ncbi:type II secretion system major pseudopilin GspG [Paraglaciecola aquimarina]|uniref:Type II secretion system core protein G n=1 Tax=Paraglaciecola algarum TaxID=3050085 RepID=A0ABS9D6Q6_9ALTE|nr:type II secretion system major pseudopilin GspG [Paraglaciecola sp. G1-23]MCF2948445.1 type II secretion system major pseudopilin GspG [Paraglaciecola sp. G1-23]
MNRKRRKLIGFTLIELLIVMVILGLLASLVAPTMFGKVASSKQKTAKAQMQMLATAVDAFRLDTGDFPQDLKDLRQSTGEYWDGPYMPKDIPLDPWGKEYVLVVAENGIEFSLISYGKDGEPGGEGEDEDVEY